MRTSPQTKPGNHRFAAEVLRASSRGLAAMATDHLIDTWPETANRYAPDACAKWRENFNARLEDLAAALDISSPRVFCDQLAWAKIAFHARSVPTDDLLHSLEALRHILSEDLPEPARSTSLEFLDAGLESFRSAPLDAPSALSTGTPHGSLAADYLLALLEGDRRRASQIILDAAESGVPVEDIYLRVFNPVQQELGRMWHLNEITVAEEHFATATTQLAMSLLYPWLPRQKPNGKTVVAASVEGNAHDIGVRMVADFLEMGGFRVIYLGANVPADDLASACIDFNADILALSASMNKQLASLSRSISTIRNTKGLGSLRILVGGKALDGIDNPIEFLNADATASSAPEALSAALRLVG